MSHWTDGPEISSGASFAARLRLCRMPLGQAVESTGGADDVLDATRRLHAARRVLDASSDPASPSPPKDLARELLQMEQRLVRLAQHLIPRGGEVDRLVTQTHPSVDSGQDAVAMAMLQRGRGYFDEWRLLLLEEQSPARQLVEFAASPYVDMLERHHPRLGLLLDEEGVLLRLLNPHHVREGVPPPAPGTRLEPLDTGDLRQVAWESLAPMPWVPLGRGLLLVQEEMVAGPLPQPSR